MPKFLNKNELVLLSLIILLFDVSGFCAISFPYIVNGNGSLTTIIIMMFVLTYSFFVFHTICNSFPTYTDKYTPTIDHISSSCADKIEDIKNDKELEINEMKKICTEKPINQGTYLAEKLVLSIVAIIFIMFIYVGVFKVYNVDDNTKGSRMLRAIPMSIVAFGVLAFAHIYIPYISNIEY